VSVRDSPRDVNLDITILSSAFNAAQKQGHVSVNPCAAVEPLPDTSERKDTFTLEQVTALVAAAEGDWRGLILTAFYTGARLGDCANLRWKKHRPAFGDSHDSIQATQGAKSDVIIAIHPALADYLLNLPAPPRMKRFVSVTGESRRQPVVEIFPALDAASTHQAAGDFASVKPNGRSVNALRPFTSQPAPLVFRRFFQANAGVREELRMGADRSQPRATCIRATPTTNWRPCVTLFRLLPSQRKPHDLADD
jgi:hypothetical protein